VVSGGFDLAPADGVDPPRVTQDHPVHASRWLVTARGAEGAQRYKLTAFATCV
jgi:hypothetical protein